MWPVIGLAFGVALGFAGWFGGFGAFVIVLVLGLIGWMGGHAIAGETNLGEMFSFGRRRRRQP
ncbi:hypothetical protein ACFY4C_05685 [Actinomadura viridis]|uniref:hypothetical protein n=1 Tax=Actinomadura viridis TaxID=58110 RepID=UPI0036BD4705